MKAEELMTGDWVRISLSNTNLDNYKGKVAKVTELKSYPNWNSVKVTTGGLDDYYCERDDEIEPIPLTAEILEKNGFERQRLNKYQTQCTFSDCHCSITVTFLDALVLGKEERGIELTITGAMFHIDMEIEYVHQLQNALRLVGIEKEVTL